jgi:hypothetical protein
MIFSELIAQIKLLLLKLFFNPSGEKFYRRYKRVIEKSLFYRNAFRSLDSLNLNEHLSDLILKESKYTSSPLYLAQEKIKFGSLSFGTSLKDVMDTADSPDFISFERFQGEIFVSHKYMEQLLGRKASRIFIFCNGAFFFGEIIIPADPYASPQRQLKATRNEIKLALISEIVSKYKVSGEIVLHDNFIIKDEDGGLIYFKDTGFGYHLKYFSAKNPEIFKTLLRFFETKNNDNQIRKELLRTFISGEPIPSPVV